MLAKTIAGIIFLLHDSPVTNDMGSVAQVGCHRDNPRGHSLLRAGGRCWRKSPAKRGRSRSKIQPYSGTSTFLPLLNSGELDFGIVNAVDMGMAYHGPQRLKVGGKNDFPHSPNHPARHARRAFIVGLLVKKDSPLKSVHDIKGKRVTGEYPAHQAVWFNMFGQLATGGLTWKDVKVVPVPAVNDGIDALAQGRAEVTTGALDMAKIREADASVGVRHLSLDCSPEGDGEFVKQFQATTRGSSRPEAPLP